MQWVADRFELTEGEMLALDGKRLAGSADRMDQSKKKSAGGKFAKIVVNCLAVGSGVVLGQYDVSHKNDELQGARDLIHALDIEGKCISGDANFCGRKLLELILEQKGDYMMALKAKSPKLHGAVRAAFANEGLETADYVTEEKGHGRQEKRVYRSLPASVLPQAVTESYVGLCQVVETCRSRRETRKPDEASVEYHYYLTSLSDNVAHLAARIRDHWAIENSLHHVLDVEFGEDASRSRKGNAAVNFSVIRKVAINYLMPGKGKVGIKEQRMRAAFSDQRRSEIFGL